MRRREKKFIFQKWVRKKNSVICLSCLIVLLFGIRIHGDKAGYTFDVACESVLMYDCTGTAAVATVDCCAITDLRLISCCRKLVADTNGVHFCTSHYIRYERARLQIRCANLNTRIFLLAFFGFFRRRGAFHQVAALNPKLFEIGQSDREGERERDREGEGSCVHIYANWHGFVR